MAGRMWMGTRGYETWVPAPAISPDYSRIGYSVSSQYIEGGFGQRQSKTAHQAFVFTWTQAKTRDAIRLITDFADHVFDSEDGVNLIYFIDPMAADKNVLNQGFATPVIASEDGYPLVIDGRPSAVPTTPNTNRYPARSARYTVGPTSKTRKQYIPIPPGYSAWVGIHGDVDAQDRIAIQRYTGLTPVGSPLLPTILAVTTTVRVNTEIRSQDGYTGIELTLPLPVASASFTLAGMIVQILPTGETPETGGFISGQGHSGCEFVQWPAKTPLSSKLDRVGATARLEETGMFL